MSDLFRNIRIRNKLFLAYSCAFLLAFAVAGVIIYFQVGIIIQQSIESELSRTTETIRSMVCTNADVSIRNYMRTVAEKNYELANHFYRQMRRGRLTEAEAKKRARDAFRAQTIGKTGHIYCLDSSGIMVVHPKRSLVGVDLSGLSFVKEQVKRKSGYLEFDWKEPLEREARPKAISMTYFEPWDWIITATAYRDEFAQLVQVDDFRKRILELGFGKSGYPYVLDYHGDMLIHPHREGQHYSEYGDPALSAVAERIVKEKNGHFDYAWKNPGDVKARKKVAYFRDIPELGWIVASSSYYRDFEGPQVATGYVIIVALGVALILLIPISIWIGALITRPLKEFQSQFARAADGDFSVRMPEHFRDELGLLAGYFNSFMEKLTQYSNSLRSEIAERKRAEEKLIALDKAKTMFLSSASHELRTPLTSIIGFLKLMEKNFNKQFLPHLDKVEGVGPRAARFVENLHVVRSESDRLGRLVNDLLDLNKIESGRMEWREENLDVESVLSQAAGAIAAYAAENPGIELLLEPPPVGATFRADADRIHQILINLLSNAFKYTDVGTVTLSARVVERGVEFAVCDTGRGISEDDQAKVFDIFYQAQDVNMRSSKVFGTGLGLAICRQIVSHYDGELTLKSTQGKGSCFIAFIPFGSGV